MDTYKATNTLNGKFYIGSTTNFEKRKQEHLKSKKNYPFQNALRNNPEAFQWEVWHDDSSEPVLEQALLDTWFGKEMCYNLNPQASRPPSQAGRPVSLVTRKKQSLIRRGRKPTASTRRKLSEAMTGNQNWAGTSPCSVSGENNPLNKKVKVAYPDGTLKVFSSTKEAGKKLGVHPVSVATHARTNNTPTKGKLAGISFSYLK
jgi:group I intron endonuclease